MGIVIGRGMLCTLALACAVRMGIETRPLAAQSVESSGLEFPSDGSYLRLQAPGDFGPCDVRHDVVLARGSAAHHSAGPGGAGRAQLAMRVDATGLRRNKRVRKRERGAIRALDFVNTSRG